MTHTPSEALPTLTDAPAPTAPSASGSRQPNLSRRWSDGLAPPRSNDPTAPWSMAEQWPGLVATLSEQAVESSNLILRALDFLVGAGRLRRAEAKALTESLYQLRDTSLRAQQITRLAGGRIRQARDRVSLAEVVDGLLRERRDEFTAKAAAITADIAAVDVLLDPPVAVSLVDTLLDWALSFSRSVRLCVQPPEPGGAARLVARVALPDPATRQNEPQQGPWGTRERGRRLNDGLQWMLLRQIAASADLQIARSSADGHAVITIEFPRTYTGDAGLACVELLGQGTGGQSALDGWVLVIAGDRQVLADAIDALDSAGVEATGAGDLQTARELLATSRPAALVVAWDVRGTDFAAMREELLGRENACPVVEITQRSPTFHTLGFTGVDTPKVGQADLRKELAATVLFELAKAG
jgi:hypothetical protein